MGIANDHNVMLTNPGNLGSIDKMSFSSLLLIDYLRVKQNDSYTDHIAASPRQLSLALPLSFIGTVAFSFSKESDAAVRFRNTFTGIQEVDSINVNRTGGMNSWQVGWGHAIGEWIHLGLAYERTNFAINNYQVTVFEAFKRAEDSTRVLFKGNSIRFGLLAKIDKVSLGFSGRYSFKGTITQDSVFTSKVLGFDAQKYATSNSGEVEPPPSFSFGAGYTISPNWLVGSDLSFTLWKNYSISKNNILAPIEAKNTLAFSAGARYIPAPKILAPKYWEIMHYRAGARITQLPGDFSYEASASFGLGFPLRANGLFDLGVDIGRRFCDLYSGYRENFITIALGVNGGRKWHKSRSVTY